MSDEKKLVYTYSTDNCIYTVTIGFGNYSKKEILLKLFSETSFMPEKIEDEL